MVLPKIVRRFRNCYLPVVMRFLPKIDAKPPCYRFFPLYVNENDVVFEVGTYLGGSTRLLGKLAKEVYAFEPHPSHFACTRQYVRDLRNVHVFPVAIANFEGPTKLKLLPDDVSNVTASIRGLKGRVYTKEIFVEAHTLDSYSELQPDVLVCDCEGSEVDVIKGGGRALTGLRAAIIETHPFDEGHTLPFVEDWAKDKFNRIQVVPLGGNCPWVLAEKTP